MINEKTHRQIEKDGLKNDFKLGNCGGELDVNGNYVFIIRLLPTGKRLAKTQEQKRKKGLEENNQHDGGGSFCMCGLCQFIRRTPTILGA